ncbi:hypothetical protein [Phytoactinopolyspora halotolerans]|uniref:Uncharacterized protein n=1 Tax=Phytoactinopolyspora halotolerans TaxID=1981512 RepID=A0A6L9SG93_9ACTN|nr:hypothetical protein [Phytoactinopolyspora halotolerans]NEE04375.1 hypothetical protein [Phytoactinopolyspora halotolerans]
MSRELTLALILLVPLVALITVLSTGVALVRRLWRVVRSGHRRGRPAPASFGLVGAASLGSATLVFCYAHAAYIPWFDIDDYCALGNRYEVTDAPFRLSATCTGGGRVVEFVPGWVNPTTVTLTLFSVVSVIGMITAWVVRAIANRDKATTAA